MKNKKLELLITGGTGTLGKALVKRIGNSPDSAIKGIRIFSRDELKQSQLRTEFTNLPHLPPIAYIIGDIRDRYRLEEALRGVDIVIHAAALKQVPAAEENPLEYLNTNIYGTENVARACIRQGVKTALLISTDKAVEPINLYGASKMCAEKLWTKASIYSGGKGTKFITVRYGNVLGSRGSILDILRKNKNNKFPITDPNMTRFWIPIENVINFILLTLEIGKANHIYVPWMPSCTLGTFLEACDINIDKWNIVGKRPGEKLHEMIINQEEVERTISTITLWAFEDHLKSGAFIITPSITEYKKLMQKGNLFYKNIEDNTTVTSYNNSFFTDNPKTIKILLGG